jgi:hypothetical protein
VVSEKFLSSRQRSFSDQSVSRHVVNVIVYNQAGNEGTMYSAPSPFDEPTKPIDVQTLRAWWMHQRHETHSTTSDAAATPGPGAIAGWRHD